jgi:hypothetical protein
MPTDDAELERQRDEGIRKALEVTRMLAEASGLVRGTEGAMHELKLAADVLADAKMTQAYGCVEKTMAQLNVLLSRAAGNADAEEFDRVRGAMETLAAAIGKATEQALDEAAAEGDQDCPVDDGVAAAMLLKSKEASDHTAGISKSRYEFKVPKLVEDAVVLVAEGRPLIYDRTAADRPWRPVADAHVNCAHVLSGGRNVLVSEHAYVSADGKYLASNAHELCRVDKKGVARALPGKLKGTCVFRVEDSLVAVGDDGALHSLDLEGDGKWKVLYDRLKLVSAGVAHDRMVVVTSNGRALETRIDGDLSCLNDYTSWVEVVDTEGLRATAVGFRAPEGMTFSHPDGRTMKVGPAGEIRLDAGLEDLVVRVGTPEGLHNLEDGYVSLDVHSGPGADLDALMHFDYTLFSRPFKQRDFAFSWKIIRAPGGYFVYNDFAANSWLGYDQTTDSVVIVNSDNPDRVAWKISPEPDLSL